MADFSYGGRKYMVLLGAAGSGVIDCHAYLYARNNNLWELVTLLSIHGSYIKMELGQQNGDLVFNSNSGQELAVIKLANPNSNSGVGAP